MINRSGWRHRSLHLSPMRVSTLQYRSRKPRSIASTRTGKSVSSQAIPVGFCRPRFVTGATAKTLITINRHNPSGARHRYENVSASSSETHEILDFTIGKDVGLGVFGSAGSSILGGGIRFAQFHYKSSVAVYADPDYTWTQVSGPPQKYFHNYDAKAKNRMSFTGVGPSLSWDASVPLHGNIQNGQITFDWGLNGAVLFGRQKSQGFNEAKGVLDTGVNISFLNLFYHTTHYTRPHSHSRSRMVTVPNIGAMAGISFRYGAAKISLGYNADLFFGAMDGGIDTARKENVGFYGPFAAISVGLGG